MTYYSKLHIATSVCPVMTGYTDIAIICN